MTTLIDEIDRLVSHGQLEKAEAVIYGSDLVIYLPDSLFSRWRHLIGTCRSCGMTNARYPGEAAQDESGRVFYLPSGHFSADD